MKNVLYKEFGLDNINIKKLNGYENENFLIQSNGIKYIFKTYRYSENLFNTIVAENDILLQIKSSPDQQYPVPIQFKDGSNTKILLINGVRKICRLLTFLHGDFLGDVVHTKSLFESLGEFLAKTDLDLKELENTDIKSKICQWDLNHFLLNKKYLKLKSLENRIKSLEYFFNKYEEHIVPIKPLLRKQIIQNDANDTNVLTSGEKVTGLIDFGDVSYSFLISELAICITYACLEKDDILKWANHTIKAYHNILPLTQTEIKCLYYLIGARLVTSICNSANSRIINPKNIYATSSEEKAIKMLDRLMKISPPKAETTFLDTLSF